MPLASLPANLVAVPLAGAVMVWGLTAGLLAGAAGGSLAAALHLPTGVALGALAAVARTAAALALGELGWAGTAAVAAGALCALRWREARPCLARAGAALALGALALTVAAAAAPPALRASPIPGVVIWRSGGATAVELSGRGAGAAPGAQEVLEAVRRAGVRSVELVIVGDQGVRPEVLATLGRRYGAPPVAGPPAGAEAGGWHAFSPQGATVRIGALALEIVVSDGRLVVEGRPAR